MRKGREGEKEGAEGEEKGTDSKKIGLGQPSLKCSFPRHRWL